MSRIEADQSRLRQYRNERITKRDRVHIPSQSRDNQGADTATLVRRHYDYVAEVEMHSTIADDATATDNHAIVFGAHGEQRVSHCQFDCARFFLTPTDSRNQCCVLGNRRISFYQNHALSY